MGSVASRLMFCYLSCIPLYNKCKRNIKICIYIVRTYRRTVSVCCHKKCKYFFVLRTSGAGGSRNSQYGVFGTEKIKDPRPVNDKAFIQQCIKQLCEVTC